MHEIAQRYVEWYRVHTNGVALREMAQRNVEWYRVHTNDVALREMAQRNVKWYTVHTNAVISTKTWNDLKPPTTTSKTSTAIRKLSKTI